MLSQGVLGAQGLDDAMRQFYMQGGIAGDVASNQFGQERARAQQGFDLESRDLNNALNSRWVGMAQGAAGVASRIPWFQQSGSGFRQVDGQDSIVPDYDK